MTIEARKIRLIMELRRSGITDTRVLAALERVPREMFIPHAFADKAYDNTTLPIGQGQTISQPYVVAMMTQSLEIDPRHKVLEVGTGSGYQAAILSQLCRRVYTMERHKSLLKEAEQRFGMMRLHNITTLAGDGYQGWPEKNQVPFDRIIVTAAANKNAPDTLLNQLALDGIMIIPIRISALKERLIRIQRTESGFDIQDLMDVRFVPLISESEMFMGTGQLIGR